MSTVKFSNMTPTISYSSFQEPEGIQHGLSNLSPMCFLSPPKRVTIEGKVSLIHNNFQPLFKDQSEIINDRDGNPQISSRYIDKNNYTSTVTTIPLQYYKDSQFKELQIVQDFI